jgi:non-heme chloroperoxidase
MLWLFALAILSANNLTAQQPPAKPGVAPTEKTQVDTSPHTVQFVAVDKDVKLEVLDWGGTGQPLVLLAGLGNDAHNFDAFAPKLTARYHVYGITRRGFGLSSMPVPTEENYTADRLGDDVLALVDALKLDHPVLVGHSIAGEELSSIGTRHPEKIAGLIYLDAAYPYAYYNGALGDTMIDLIYLQRALTALMHPVRGQEQKARVKELAETSVPRFERELQTLEKHLQTMPDSAPAPPDTLKTKILVAITLGATKYDGVKCPALAIYADPHDMADSFKGDPKGLAAAEANDATRTSAQADAFQAGNPSSRVVRLANANHYIFKSNEADVLREINAFLAMLPN